MGGVLRENTVLNKLRFKKRNGFSHVGYLAWIWKGTCQERALIFLQILPFHSSLRGTKIHQKVTKNPKNRGLCNVYRVSLLLTISVHCILSKIVTLYFSVVCPYIWWISCPPFTKRSKIQRNGDYFRNIPKNGNLSEFSNLKLKFKREKLVQTTKASQMTKPTEEVVWNPLQRGAREGIG
jgi:hypothetical protein